MDFFTQIITGIIASCIFTIILIIYKKYKSKLDSFFKKLLKGILIVLGGFVTLIIAMSITDLLTDAYHHRDYLTFTNTSSDTSRYKYPIEIAINQGTYISLNPEKDSDNWYFQFQLYYDSQIDLTKSVPFLILFKKLNIDTLYIKEFNPYQQIDRVQAIIGNYNHQRIEIEPHYNKGGCELVLKRNQKIIFTSSIFLGQEYLYLKAWGEGYDYNIEMELNLYF